ncbi:trypsin-like serine protease [Verrucomicrobiota bacterium]
MKRICYYFLIVVLLFGFSRNAHAIATADQSTSEAPPTGAGYSLTWDYVYKYKSSTAVAVDHYWVLAAAHVADDGGTGNLSIDGTTYYQQEVIFHSTAADPDGNEKADLALIRYDKPLPGYYLLNNSVHVGSEIVMVGYGFPGSVVQDAPIPYFTQNSSGSRIRRWGTNRIDYEKTYQDKITYPSISKGFDISISTTHPNAGGTDFEAGANIYDSGCGMFYNDNGTWKLNGLMSQRYPINDTQHAGNFAVAVNYYVNWIKSVIVDYDTDMDQLPDWWEDQYFPGTGSTADADDDGDGQNNLHEFYAGTDPNDSMSLFELQSAVTNDTGSAYFSVTFPATTNRTYFIEESSNLQSNNWASTTNLSVETAGDIEFLDPVEVNLNFYRVNINLY